MNIINNISNNLTIICWLVAISLTIILIEIINWIFLKIKNNLIKTVTNEGIFMRYTLKEKCDETISYSGGDDKTVKFTFWIYCFYFYDKILFFKLINIIIGFLSFNDEKYKIWMIIITFISILLIFGILNIQNVIDLIDNK